MKDMWQVWESALGATECDNIVAKADSYPEAKTVVGFDDDSRSDESIRKSTIKWFSRDKEMPLVDRIMWFVNSSNRTNFGCDIVAPYDIQFTEYYGSSSDRYDWHQDSWHTRPQPFDRKLSVVVQLSDPADYEGGTFEFLTAPSPGKVFVPKGSILIFPSFLAHRVLPVTGGTRRSLVTWVEGPRWR